MLRSVRSFVAIAALGGVGSVIATPQNITPGELALTPAYCQDVQSINGWTKEKGTRSPRAEYWLSLMGETFWAMHHYCWGLIQMQRSRAAGITAQQRTFLRHEAIDEYRYVLKNSPPSFVLLPEVYLRIGDAHAALEEYSPAFEAYAKSRAIKPDYWPAYAREARLLETAGLKTKAVKLLEEGLQHVPNSPELQAQLRRLGGKFPDGASTAKPGPSATSPGTIGGDTQ